MTLTLPRKAEVTSEPFYSISTSLQSSRDTSELHIPTGTKCFVILATNVVPYIYCYIYCLLGRMLYAFYSCACVCVCVCIVVT